MKLRTLIALGAAAIGVAHFSVRGQVLLSAAGGPVPINYQPVDFRLWPTTPVALPSITDADPATGVTFQGLDNALQSNGAFADTGTFLLLRYLVPPDTQSFSFRYRGQSNRAATPAHFGPNLITDAGQWFEFWSVTQPPPAGFVDGTLVFTDTGNNGGFSLSQGFNAQQVIGPDGTVLIAMQGGPIAALNEPGAFQTFYADFELIIPEPATVSAGLVGVIGCRRRRRR